jgi:hypothetical protein
MPARQVAEGAHGLLLFMTFTGLGTNMRIHRRSPRLAHERVLTSGRRAWEIVPTHRSYFRIRADIELMMIRRS